MKRICAFIFCAFASAVLGQAPEIAWKKTFGSSNLEISKSILPTLDGGFMVAGNTAAFIGAEPNGDVTDNHGNSDYWLVKLNGSGAIVWQKSYGGSQADECISVTATSDGGYLAAGMSNSVDGDISAPATPFGHCWVIKLDADGNLIWDASLMATTFYHIGTTTDGGYMLNGLFYNNGNSFSTIKTDAMGNFAWGYNNDDNATFFDQAPNADYIISSVTADYDIKITRLNSNGEMQWSRLFGGSQNDFTYNVKALSDGSCIFAGYTKSTDGNVEVDNRGNFDYWVVKLDALGSIEWQKAFGGAQDDFAVSISQTPDDGFIVFGSSYSSNSDLISNQGMADYWVIKINSQGLLQWQKNIGGSGEEIGYCMVLSADGSLAMTGFTTSNNGDVQDNHGETDYWVVKMNAEVLSGQNFNANNCSIYPNPAISKLYVQLDGQQSIESVQLTDMSGKRLLQTAHTNEINVTGLSAGMYCIEATASGKSYRTKFIKQ